jgi:hypothetical protein
VTDDEIRMVIEGVLAETPELGETPRNACFDYLARTAPTIENGVRPAEPLLRGDEMIRWEGPKSLFERMVLNDRRWRKEHRD